MGQQSTAMGLGYQADLFNPHAVTKKIKKPTAARPQPLEAINLQLGEVRATARKYLVAKQTVYHVVFSDDRKPLVITLAATFNDKDFWTSLPEGRQQEAEQIGKLIDCQPKE